MKQYLLALLFICTCSTIQLHAQQQLHRQESLVLNQNTARPADGRNKQFVFYTIVNSLPEKERNINISYILDYVLIAKSSGYGTTILSIEFNRMTVANPVLYRDFDVSQFVFPDVLGGQFKLTDAKNQLWSKSFSIDNPVPDQEIILGQIELPIASTLLQNVIIDQFDFSNALVFKMESTVMEINEYLATTKLLGQIVQQFEQEGTKHEDDLLSLFVNWDISRKALNNAKHFLSNTFITTYHLDNQVFETNYNALSRINTRLETLLIAKSKEVGAAENARPLLANRYLASLEKYRDLSKLGDFRDSETILAIANIQPDQDLAEKFNLFETENKKGQLRKEIYFLLTAKSDELIYKGDYATAISILESLNNGSFFMLNQEELSLLSNKLHKARIGLLQSYFQITSKSLQAANDEMAETYFRKSKDFFKKGFNSIPDDDIRLEATRLIAAFEDRANRLKQSGENASAVQMFENAYQASILFDNKSLAYPINNAIADAHNIYFNSLITKAKNALAAGNKNDAILYCDQALYYASAHPGFIADEAAAYALRNKLGQPVFNTALEAGMDAASNGDNETALDVIKAAKALAVKQGLNPTTNLDSLQAIIAKPIIIRKLRGANSKVWANKLDLAWTVYDEAKNMTEQYKLQADADISDEFKRLDQKLIERICLNTNQTYNELILTAERFGRQQRITELRSSLDTARVLLNRNRGCNIDDSRLKELENEYQGSFSYQELYNQVLDLMYTQGFASAIGAYVDLDEQVREMNLHQQGIEHLDLFEFLKQQANSNLSSIALEYFLNENQLDRAKSVLPILLEQLQDTKSIGALLERTAQQFAIADAKKTPTFDPEQLAISYFHGDKKYKSYLRAYVKSFKSVN